MAITAAQVKQFVIQVDARRNGGNGNGYVDGSEIDLFSRKIKTADNSIDVQDIMDNYSKNKYKMEAEYEANGTTSSSAVREAVIAALTEKTALKSNEKAQNSDVITEGLKSEGGWFDDLILGNNEELAEYANKMDVDNVMGVVADDEAIEALNESSDETQLNTIKLLLQAAKAQGLDVSNIVMEKDGKLCVGRDVPNGNAGEEIVACRNAWEWLTGEDSNFVSVVKELRAAITEGKKTLNGEGDKHEMLTLMARKIDADGNGNGYIDGAQEAKALKQFAAEYGIDVVTILEEVRDNVANGVENTTDAQKTIYNIFDPQQREAKRKAVEGHNADIAAILNRGFGSINPAIIRPFSWDSDVVKDAASMINSDNVMEVIEKCPEIADILDNRMDWSFSKNNYNDVMNTVIDSLIKRAKEEGIEIDDIVVDLGNDYAHKGQTFTEKEAKNDGYVEAWWDSDDKSEIIKKLVERIKSVENV